MITYNNILQSEGDEAVKYELHIYKAGYRIGFAEYRFLKDYKEDNTLTVTMIYVLDRYRRQGHGSRLMKYIKQLHPEYDCQPSELKSELGQLYKFKDVSLTKC